MQTFGLLANSRHKFVRTCQWDYFHDGLSSLSPRGFTRHAHGRPPRKLLFVVARRAFASAKSAKKFSAGWGLRRPAGRLANTCRRACAPAVRSISPRRSFNSASSQFATSRNSFARYLTAGFQEDLERKPGAAARAASRLLRGNFGRSITSPPSP